MKVNFHFNLVQPYLPNRRILKEFVIKLFNKEGKPLQNVDYVFCTDEFLLQLNQDFLQHDYYTDIITFTLSAPKLPIEGEIYISTERIKENAKEYDRTSLNELHRVMFHGALHLCGYKDETKRQKAIMTSKEDYYLKLWNKVPRGTSA